MTREEGIRKFRSYIDCQRKGESWEQVAWRIIGSSVHACWQAQFKAALKGATSLDDAATRCYNLAMSCKPDRGASHGKEGQK